MLPTRCAVVGGGRMGSGIAHALLIAGSHVTLIDADAAAADAAAGRVAKAVAASAERGSLTEPVDVVMSRLEPTDDYACLADAGLVIEAVPEVESLKLDVFRRLEEVLDPLAAIATNTSSLSVTRMAAQTSIPSRVIGMHFFNPVPASLLVEIVLAEQTATGLVDRARQWVADLGKTPIVVKDSPGLATSRLGNILGVEAMRMVEEGVASVEDIDTGMVLGYKHPVGPLKLTDLIGLDVRLDICTYLAEAIGPQFTPPQILVDKVARGELGRKTGKGFYDWSD